MLLYISVMIPVDDNRKTIHKIETNTINRKALPYINLDRDFDHRPALLEQNVLTYNLQGAYHINIVCNTTKKEQERFRAN